MKAPSCRAVARDPVLPISKIKVSSRYRKDLGDLAGLAASVKELGLLHPVVVRSDRRLIAGERRLQACKLLGWKTHEEVKVLLKESHVLVAPSLTSEGGDQEGIPNAIKEAMASGLPVISTFHSGIPELVTDGVSGLLVPERDAASIADSLAYLISHPEICNEMGQAGRMQVEQKFDTNLLNKQLEELYLGLMQKA